MDIPDGAKGGRQPPRRASRTVDLGELAWRRIVVGLVVFLVIAMFNPLGVKRNSETATQDFFETIFAAILPPSAITTPQDAYHHILNHGPLTHRDINEAAAAEFAAQMQVTDWSVERSLRQSAPNKARPWAPIHILRFDDTVMAKIDPLKADPATGSVYRRYGRHQLPLEKVSVMLGLLARLQVSVIFLDIRFLTDTVEDGTFCADHVAEWRKHTRHPATVDLDRGTGAAGDTRPLLFLAGLSAGHAVRARVAQVMDANRIRRDLNLDPAAVPAEPALLSVLNSATDTGPFWLPARFDCLRDIGQFVPVQWVGDDYPIGIGAGESNHESRTIRQLGQLAAPVRPGPAKASFVLAMDHAVLPSVAVDLIAAWCLHPRSLIQHFPQCNPRVLALNDPDAAIQPRREAIRAALGVRSGVGADGEPARLSVRPYARTPVIYKSLPDSLMPAAKGKMPRTLPGMTAVHGCRPENAFLDDYGIHDWHAFIAQGRYAAARLMDEVLGNRHGGDDAYSRGCANIAMHEAFFSSTTWPLSGKPEWARYVKQSFVGSAVIVAGNFDNAADTVPSSLFGNKVGAYLHAEALQCLLWYGDRCPRRAGAVLLDLDVMDLMELAVLLLLLLMSRQIVRNTFVANSSGAPDRPARRVLRFYVRPDYALGYQVALLACLPVAVVATVAGMAFLPYPSADLLALVLVLGVVFREGAVGLAQRLLWILAR